MNHDELSDLLQSLPRSTASGAFTAETLARARGHRGQAMPLRNAYALALTFLILLGSALAVRHHQQDVRLQKLRAERQEIQKQLDDLKALTNERDPRVFVGSSGSYDFVVGLKESSKPAQRQPVSLHIANDGIS